jgi:hypothetical protein
MVEQTREKEREREREREREEITRHCNGTQNDKRKAKVKNANFEGFIANNLAHKQAKEDDEEWRVSDGSGRNEANSKSSGSNSGSSDREEERRWR